MSDVYSLTVAACITRKVSPTEYIFCLRQCIFVFVFQCSIATFFAYEELYFDAFDTKIFSILNTIMRLICALLL